MPGIGIGISPVFSRGGQSWESYWKSQAEVLFFGLYSEISGGQMPNKVSGSSDYLTVAGVAGSETYQCPNTAPYQTADTDYIWFNYDTSQRTVTTVELVGYDLQRTPVKYNDTSPNAIVAIIILNAAVTGTQRDNLFRDMWLPILWDNSLNIYGHVKSNRIGYTPFPLDYGWEAETDALIARMGSTLTIPEQDVLNDTIVSLKTGGFWAKANIIRFYHAKSEADSFLNWIGNTFLAATAGAGNVFTVKGGWRSGNYAGGINENFVPSTDGGALFTQNDASDIYYFASTASPHSIHIHGAVDSTATKNTTMGDLSSANAIHRINSGNAGYMTATLMVNGLNGNIRTGAAVCYNIANSTKTNSTTASTTLVNKSLHTGCRNNNGTLDNGGTTQVTRFRFIGASLSQAEFNTLKTIVETFLTNF